MHMPRSTAVLLLSGLALSGCGNPAMQQAQQAAAPIEAHCRTQLASPQYEFIRAKVAMEDPGQIPIAKLSNQQRPSPAEQPVIAQWAQLRADCLTQILNVGRSYNLNINPATAATLQHAPRAHSLAAELASGQISYGEHNRRYSELAQTADSAGAAVIAEQQRQAAAETAILADNIATGVTNAIMYPRYRRR